MHRHSGTSESGGLSARAGAALEAFAQRRVHAGTHFPLQGLLQVAYSYQSQINFGLNQDPQTIQKAYG